MAAVGDASAKDVDDLLRIVLLYLPSAAARQMLREMSRSKVADVTPSFRAVVNRLTQALDADGPTTYATTPIAVANEVQRERDRAQAIIRAAGRGAPLSWEMFLKNGAPDVEKIAAWASRVSDWTDEEGRP